MQSGLLLAGLVMLCAAQQGPLWQSPPPEDRLWTPVRDGVYLQESPENIVT